MMTSSTRPPAVNRPTSPGLGGTAPIGGGVPIGQPQNGGINPGGMYSPGGSHYNGNQLSTGGPDPYMPPASRPPSVYGDPHTMGQPMAQPRVAGPQWQVASGAPQPYTPQTMQTNSAGGYGSAGMPSSVGGYRPPPINQSALGLPQNPQGGFLMPPGGWGVNNSNDAGFSLKPMSGGGPGEQQSSGGLMQGAQGAMQQMPIQQLQQQFAMQNAGGMAPAPKPMTMAGPASTMPASVNPATRQALLPGILRGMNT